MPKARLPIVVVSPQQVYLIRTGVTPNRRIILIFVDTDETPVPVVEAVY